MATPTTPQRISEYWDWFAVALFVLVTVDMLTTRFAAATMGDGAEANPIIRWALGQSVLVLTGINLAATVIAVGSFYILIRLLKTTRAPYDSYLARGIELWLGGLIAVGLYIFANNLSVIIHGRSLIGLGG